MLLIQKERTKLDSPVTEGWHWDYARGIHHGGDDIEGTHYNA